MPNRLPLLASLAIDKIRVKTGEDTFDEVAVSGGFIEFSNNVLSVVASAAERKEEIDTSRAERARKRAEARIAKAKENHDDNELKRAGSFFTPGGQPFECFEEIIKKNLVIFRQGSFCYI